MRAFSAHDAKQRFGSFLEAAERGPVEVRKYRRRVAVLMSAEEYSLLTKLKERSGVNPPDRKGAHVWRKVKERIRSLLPL